MKAKILTAASIKRFLPGVRRIEIPDSACRGLRVVVHPSGAKTFSMRFRGVDGAHINYVLGPVDLSGIETSGAPVKGMPMSLAGARMLGAELNRKRAMGINVVAEWKAVTHRRKVERKDRAVNAFAPLARAFIEQHAKVRTRSWPTSARLLGFKPQTLEVVKGGLADRWRDRAVAEISPDDIADVLDGIRERGDSAARVAHARIGKFFGWLLGRRLIAVNPCAGLWKPDASTPRDRILSDDEVRLFWMATDNLGQPFNVLLRLLLLLGQRRNEVGEMTWDELSEDRTVWTIPGSRTKNSHQHFVPVPRQARALIATIQSIGDTFVFSTTGVSPVSGWSKTKKRLDEKMVELAGEKIPAWRLHDLRRTCASGLQRLGIALPVTERLLNHVSGSFAGVTGIYQRFDYADEKREALQRWADAVEKIVLDTSV